jgi:multiple sugar transport system substrate-binding protein
MSNAKEDQANIAFEGGKAAFMVNYPAFYSQIKKEAPKVFAATGIAPWPSVTPGQASHTTIGGINLGVGAYSKHAALAFAAARCLRDPTNQKYAQVNGSFAPSLGALYQDPQVLKAQPFAKLLMTSLEQASLRPVSPAYTDISLAVQKTLSPPSGINPKPTTSDLKSKIDKALKSGGLL